tara:strand:+ start:3143 stop:3481 length:339 start_codon:yes stop_codon:yes gene_type:complete
LIRNGLLCKSCGNDCRKDYESDEVTVACPACDETGFTNSGLPCEHCDGGSFLVDCCPRETVGFEISEAINLAGFADKGLLPSAGGLLDQSAWWMSVYRHFTNEQSRIESEKH